MKRVRFDSGWWRAFAASVLAWCLVGSSAMSIGAGRPRIKMPSGASSISSPMTKLPERATGVDSPSGSSANTSAAHDLTRARIKEGYGNLPMAFEANIGQANSEVKFIARTSNRRVLLTSDGAAVELRIADRGLRNQGAIVARAKSRNSKVEIHNPRFNHPQSAIRNPQFATLRFKFAGASASARITGLGQLPGATNYLRGNDLHHWRTNVATYAKVEYESLYPGVDLVYYGNGQRLEYDLRLAPGANPAAIAFDVQGANRLIIDRQGALVVHTSAGDLRQEKPLVYQETNGVKQFIAGHYVMKGKRRVGFKVGHYDASKPLVIDPTLKYSFKLGGSGGDQVTGIAVDSQGNAYLMGQTLSSDFPTKDPISGALRGTTDIFVTKLNADGNAIVYSTYLGGSSGEFAFAGGVAVDACG